MTRRWGFPWKLHSVSFFLTWKAFCLTFCPFLYLLYSWKDTEQAQRCWSWRHRKWSSAMFRSLQWLRKLVWRHCLLSVFVLAWPPTLHWRKKKTTGFVVRCKHSKRTNKPEVTFSRKERLILTCHHDVSAPIRHLKILFSKSFLRSVVILALCSVAYFCYFSHWLNFP